MRNAPSFTLSYIALGLAAVCAVVWVGIVLAGNVAGASTASLFSFPLVYAGYQAAADVRLGWGFAAGLVGLGAVWCYPAHQLRRRPFDGLFAALLALQLFFLLRWLGLLSFQADVLQFETLLPIERYSLAFVLLALLALLVAWMLRPKQGKSYQMSAPSRVTGFLKKRRRSLQLLGGALMALAVGGVTVAGQVAFGGAMPGVYRWESYSFQLVPTVAASIFIAADLLYLLGRYYWYRLG